jgi:acyl-CoA thioester hydrolase
VKIFSYLFVVDSSAIDFNGHVNNVTYLEWMMRAAIRHSASVGMDYEKCLELGGTWVAKSHHLEYKKPAFEGDELRMETWVEELGKIASIRRYKLVRTTDNTLIFEGTTNWVFVDKNSFRPTKIPDVIKNTFEKQ